MFCVYKNNGDRRLMTMQYQSVAGKLKKQCKVNDTEFEMKVSVSFDDLSSQDAKYHLQCFIIFNVLKTVNLTRPVQCISILLNC